jgi:uncharacterized protein YbjT (DUF2867 family)
MRAALLLGATGLVGGHCLELLLNDSAYGKVVVVGRKLVPHEHAKLEQHVVDFDTLSGFAHLMRADDLFSCLGTTIKKAGSRENFRRVDFTYQLDAARLSREQGAKQLLLVSSLGADPHSSIFYNRVKGELETAVSELALDAVNIFRPSLLLGERAEFRAGERIAELPMRYVSFLMVGPLAKYRPVEARAVAAAMLKVAKEERTGVNVFESDQIRRMTEGA